MSNYLEVPPPECLSAYVQCLWVYQSNEPEPVHAIVPDGCPELIIHQAQPFREDNSELPQPSALFAGQLTKPLNLVSDQPTQMVGVRFKPYGARAFLGKPVDIATDKRLPLSALHGLKARTLVKNVRSAPTNHAAYKIIFEYVGEQTGDAQLDPIVRDAVEAAKAGEAFDYPDNMTARQFQRRFRRETGISLRMFRSILRFRAVFNRLRTHEDEPWVDRALATGYFGQAQMARDFQRFLGGSAQTWVRNARGLSKALADHC